MAAAEKQTIDKQVAETSKSRIQALASLQEDRWSDPYILSKRLRKSHREEKRVIQARDESDSALRSKLSLPQDLDLEEDNEQFKLEAQKEWRDAKSQASTSVRDEDSRKRRRSEIVQSSITDVPREPTSSSKKKRARVSHPAPSIPKEPKSTARDLLASRLAQQTRRASAGSSGVFDGPSSRSSSRSVRASLKGLSRLVRSSR